MDHKKRLRGFYRKKIQAKDNFYKNQALIESLSRLNLPQFLKNQDIFEKQNTKALAIAAYQPLKGEPSLLAFYRQNHRWQFAFPVVKNKEMTFYKPGNAKKWKEHSLGFKEPDTETAEALLDHQIKIFLVPGLAFDRKGRRLGRGLGCYDRFFSKKKTLKIGVAWSEQIHRENLPEDSHDVPMDIVVTEKFILTPNIRGFSLQFSEKAGYG